MGWELWLGLVGAVSGISALATAVWANMIARGERDAARENNEIARQANAQATESLKLSQQQMEREQRRDEELHEVRWNFILAGGDPSADGPNELIDQKLVAINLGPDLPHDAAMYVYSGNYLHAFQKAPQSVLAINSGFGVSLVDSADPYRDARIELQGELSDHGREQFIGPRTVDDERSWMELTARRLWDAELEIVLRWKSPSGTPYQTIRGFLRSENGWVASDARKTD